MGPRLQWSLATDFLAQTLALRKLQMVLVCLCSLPAFQACEGSTENGGERLSKLEHDVTTIQLNKHLGMGILSPSMWLRSIVNDSVCLLVCCYYSVYLESKWFLRIGWDISSAANLKLNSVLRPKTLLCYFFLLASQLASFITLHDVLQLLCGSSLADLLLLG